MFATARALIWIALAAVTPQLGATQEVCSCKFTDKSHVAFGTKAACNAFVFDDKKCEIAFSALGSSAAVLALIEPGTGQRLDPYDVTAQHIAALSKGDFEFLFSEKFLKAALPLMMRAAYARESVQRDMKEPPIAEFDKEAMAFLEEQTPNISRVFSGKMKPFGGNWRSQYRYTIGIGVVRFSHAKGPSVVTVVFSEDRKR